jgi:DMSO/TMAO reductase YedYZ molybdopterin-dependent catalytic subunit
MQSNVPKVTRRVLAASAAAASLGGLAAALATSDGMQTKRGFLGLMDAWNERFQGFLLSPSRLSKTEPASALTRPGAFPAYKIAAAVPSAPAGWRLKIGGLVEHARTFSLADLRRMTRTDVRVRHHCVEGWSAVASWHGVALRDLAESVGADPRAPYVEFRSFDEGYWSSWDRASVMHPQTLLAYGMNGEPLAPDYGAPLRLYSAVKLGYKMVKYLTEVNFMPVQTGGYWEDQGYEWFAGV